MRFAENQDQAPYNRYDRFFCFQLQQRGTLGREESFVEAKIWTWGCIYCSGLFTGSAASKTTCACSGLQYLKIIACKSLLSRRLFSKLAGFETYSTEGKLHFLCISALAPIVSMYRRKNGVHHALRFFLLYKEQLYKEQLLFHHIVIPWLRDIAILSE